MAPTMRNSSSKKKMQKNSKGKSPSPKQQNKPGSQGGQGKLLNQHRVPVSAVVTHCGGHEHLRDRLKRIRSFLDSNPRKVVHCSKVRGWLSSANEMLESAVKASIGMPSYSDGVTSQFEAAPDVPTMPLDGYQLVQRSCMIVKIASSGTTAGGFYAELIASDLKPFTTNQYYRVRKVSSWTTSRGDNSGNTSFAGVNVPVQYGSSGTEVMPIWSENRTPVGQGFAGIVTTFPLGNFPLYSEADTTVICAHYTSLGGTGGVTGIPVVFVVEVEALI